MITKKQQQVIDAIVHHKLIDRKSPSLEKLSEVTGMKKASVYSKIDSLLRKKAISFENNEYRVHF